MTSALWGLVLGLLAAAGEPDCSKLQDDFVAGAVFAEKRLWVQYENGCLVSVPEGSTSVRQEAVPDRVLGVCRRNEVVAVLTADAGAPSNWRLREHQGDSWRVVETFDGGGELFLALDCAASATTVLTSKRALLVRHEKRTVVNLTPALKNGLPTLHLVGDIAYLGLNRGEWGGGLTRVDLRTGTSTLIERKERGQVCGRPLDAECDPVNGIATSPWSPSCVVAVVGLVHMLMSGRVLEVCEDQVREIAYQPYGKEMTRDHAPDGGEDDFMNTVAFFGLRRARDQLVAVGVDGLYFVHRDRLERRPLPALKKTDRWFSLSWEVPGLVILTTAINGHHSVSGVTPLLISR